MSAQSAHSVAMCATNNAEEVRAGPQKCDRLFLR